MKMPVGIVVLALLTNPSRAQTYFCDRPAKPSCLIMLGSGDQYGFDSCRDEVLRYQRSVQEYLQCLRMEADDAADELKKTIRQFNDCASNRYC
jgi:hypothetical protein